MKALSKKNPVEYFVYTGNKEELNAWLNISGMALIGNDIFKDDICNGQVFDRDITFFNHFVVERGRLFKMTAAQFVQDYFAISEGMANLLANH